MVVPPCGRLFIDPIVQTHSWIATEFDAIQLLCLVQSIGGNNGFNNPPLEFFRFAATVAWKQERRVWTGCGLVALATIHITTQMQAGVGAGVVNGPRLIVDDPLVRATIQGRHVGAGVTLAIVRGHHVGVRGKGLVVPTAVFLKH